MFFCRQTARTASRVQTGRRIIHYPNEYRLFASYAGKSSAGDVTTAPRSQNPTIQPISHTHSGRPITKLLRTGHGSPPLSQSASIVDPNSLTLITNIRRALENANGTVSESIRSLRALSQKGVQSPADETLVATLRTLVDFYGASSLPEDLTFQLVRMFTHVELSEHSLVSLEDILLEHLPTENAKLAKPPFFVSLAFHLLPRFLKVGPDAAAKIFMRLAELDYIPSRILLDEETQHDAMHEFIYVTSIRASCHWGWPPLANRLVEDYIAGGDYSSVTVSRLIREVLSLLLDFPSRKDVKLACNLIRHTHAIAGPLPNEMVAKFYDKAARFGMVEEIADVYLSSQKVAGTHCYPFVPSTEIVSLAEYLGKHGSDDQLKHFLTEVATQNPPIPSMDCGSLILTAVRQGLPNVVQGLWYSNIRSQRRYLALDAESMMEIIRLFHLVITQRTDRLKTGNRSGGKGEGAEGHQALATWCEFAHQVTRRYYRVHRCVPQTEPPLGLAITDAYLVLENVEAASGTFRWWERVGGILADDMVAVVDSSADLDAVLHWAKHLAENGCVPTVECLAKVIDKGLRCDALEVVVEALCLLEEHHGFPDQVSLASGAETQGPYAAIWARFSSVTVDKRMRVVERLAERKPAFNLWERLIRDAIPWEDERHRALRQRMLAECGTDSVRAQTLVARGNSF